MMKGGLVACDAAELSNYMEKNTLNEFFRNFTRIFAKNFGPKHVRMLQGDELAASMKMYAMLGLPGCIGSLDATFVPCDGLSQSQKNMMNGDKGSGLLFNVIVDHFKRVLYVQDPVYATINDKISVKYNDVIEMLMNRDRMMPITFKILTGDGEDDYILLSCCYVISDGGYLSIPAIISAFSGCQTERVKYKFSDWIASVRKDVECFFGILKKRFRWFKVPNLMRSHEDVSNVFKTACILHNLILEYDGLDKLWLDDLNWSNLDPINEEKEDEQYDTENEDVDEEDNYLNDYTHSLRQCLQELTLSMNHFQNN